TCEGWQPCNCLRIPKARRFQESRMPGNPLVRFDEGRVGRTRKVSPSLLLYWPLPRWPFRRSRALAVPGRWCACRSAEEIRAVIEAFLRDCKQPALLEPGEELFPITAENFSLDLRGSRLTLQAWDRTRNLTRRVAAAGAPSSARLELTVERFAKRQGQIFL